MSGLWPWPGDTPTERARRVARSYRDALHQVDEQVCTTLDERMVGVGQDWVTPRLQHLQLDELLPAADVAYFVGVEPRLIRDWSYRGHIEKHTGVDGTPLYRLADVVAYQAAARRRRARGRS